MAKKFVNDIFPFSLKKQRTAKISKRFERSSTRFSLFKVMNIRIIVNELVSSLYVYESK